MKARGVLLTRADLDAAAREADEARSLREAHPAVVEGVAVAPHPTRFPDITDYLREGPKPPRMSTAKAAALSRRAALTPGSKAARAKTEALRKRVGL